MRRVEERVKVKAAKEWSVCRRLGLAGEGTEKMEGRWFVEGITSATVLTMISVPTLELVDELKEFYYVDTETQKLM